MTIKHTHQPPHKSDLIRHLTVFSDNMTIFIEDCAFSTDAFSKLNQDHPDLWTETTAGLERQAHWLKQRAKKLGTELDQIKLMCQQVIATSD